MWFKLLLFKFIKLWKIWIYAFYFQITCKLSCCSHWCRRNFQRFRLNICNKNITVEYTRVTCLVYHSTIILLNCSRKSEAKIIAPICIHNTLSIIQLMDKICSETILELRYLDNWNLYFFLSDQIYFMHYLIIVNFVDCKYKKFQEKIKCT